MHAISQSTPESGSSFSAMQAGAIQNLPQKFATAIPASDESQAGSRSLGSLDQKICVAFQNSQEEVKASSLLNAMNASARKTKGSAAEWWSGITEIPITSAASYSSLSIFSLFIPSYESDNSFSKAYYSPEIECILEEVKLDEDPSAQVEQNSQPENPDLILHGSPKYRRSSRIASLAKLPCAAATSNIEEEVCDEAALSSDEEPKAKRRKLSQGNVFIILHEKTGASSSCTEKIAALLDTSVSILKVFQKCDSPNNFRYHSLKLIKVDQYAYFEITSAKVKGQDRRSCKRSQLRSLFSAMIKFATGLFNPNFFSDRLIQSVKKIRASLQEDSNDANCASYRKIFKVIDTIKNLRNPLAKHTCIDNLYYIASLESLKKEIQQLP